MAVARITKRFVDACTPAVRPVFIFDETLKGFGLKVNPSGGKNYIVEYRVGAGGRLSRKRRITIASTTELSPEQARNRARDILAAARIGDDPAGNRSTERKIPDFKSFAYRYLNEEAKSRLKPATIQNYEINIRRHSVPYIGSLKLTEITRKEIQHLHCDIGRTSKIQANRTIETISAVYRYAQTLGLVEDGYNPTNGIRSFKETPRVRYLSEDEFMRLGAALRLAETEGIPWVVSGSKTVSKHTVKPENQKTVFPKGATDTIRLLMFTGCRLREILNLTWQEVDMERGLLFLADSKTGARTVVLNQIAMEILHHQNQTGKYVFPSDSSDAPRADLNKPWRAIRRHADVEDLRLHDLRHSFASVGAGAGMGLPIVGALLGCQRRSKNPPLAGVKVHHFGVAEGCP